MHDKNDKHYVHAVQEIKPQTAETSSKNRGFFLEFTTDVFFVHLVSDARSACIAVKQLASHAHTHTHLHVRGRAHSATAILS